MLSVERSMLGSAFTARLEKLWGATGVPSCGGTKRKIRVWNIGSIGARWRSLSALGLSPTW
jgi:hypothetical protein